MSRISNGDMVEDKITGFRGTVTGLVSYITGCDQALVSPRGTDAKGEPKESKWFDVQRLDVDDSVPRIILDNGTTPGFCEEAPKR